MVEYPHAELLFLPEIRDNIINTLAIAILNSLKFLKIAQQCGIKFNDMIRKKKSPEILHIGCVIALLRYTVSKVVFSFEIRVTNVFMTINLKLIRHQSQICGPQISYETVSQISCFVAQGGTCHHY